MLLFIILDDCQFLVYKILGDLTFRLNIDQKLGVFKDSPFSFENN
jgi:hypothetical protein